MGRQSRFLMLLCRAWQTEVIFFYLSDERFIVALGLMCVTCTDMAVLCGVHADTCFSKYGSLPSHGPYCHEFVTLYLLGTIRAQAIGCPSIAFDVGEHRQSLSAVYRADRVCEHRLLCKGFRSRPQVSFAGKDDGHVSDCACGFRPLSVACCHRLTAN
jgi:hypothetical protein